MNPDTRKMVAVGFAALLVAGCYLMATGQWEKALRLAEIAAPVTIVLTVLAFR